MAEKWTEVGCKWIELARAQHWTALVPAGPTSGPLPVRANRETSGDRLHTSPYPALAAPPAGRPCNEVDRKWTGSGPGRYQCDPVLGQSYE